MCDKAGETSASWIRTSDSGGRCDAGETAIDAALREALGIETDVLYEDAFFKFGPVTSSPRPVQRPHPPIFIAAVGTPASFDWAGQQGHGLMVVPYLSNFDALRENLGRYRDAYQAAKGALLQTP